VLKSVQNWTVLRTWSIRLCPKYHVAVFLMLVYTARTTVYYSVLISLLDLPSTDIRKSRLLETLLLQIKKVRCGLSNDRAAFSDLEWLSRSFTLYKSFKCHFSRGYARADKILAATERRAVPLWQLSLSVVIVRSVAVADAHSAAATTLYSSQAPIPCYCSGSTPSQEFVCGVFCSSDAHEIFTEINVVLARLTHQERLCKPIRWFQNIKSSGLRREPHWRSLHLFPRPYSWWEGEQHRSPPLAWPSRLRCSNRAISKDLHNVVDGLAPMLLVCSYLE